METSARDARIAEIQAQVLQVFRRVNPTRRRYARDDESCRALRHREEVIFANLGFERSTFDGARVLDAGCGTGDVSFMLADWGAKVDGFDLNQASVGHAQRMARQLGLENSCHFVCGSVFDPPFSGTYDFVQCLGVLPHTGDPASAYRRLAAQVRPGGHLYVALINRYGFALRAAKRGIVHLLAGGEPERKARHARALWRGHIRRAAKFGVRTEEQIAWDNFVAPHLTSTIGDWFGWMENCGLTYVSSYPSFFSLRLPSQSTGGIERLTATEALPRSVPLRTLLTTLVQLRWATALGVGGLASISFVAQKTGGQR